jgi:hypothetical protein
LQHPLFFDALQASLQKIDLQRLLSDLPLQRSRPERAHKSGGSKERRNFAVRGS